jgi:hypothetical protein
MLQNEALEHKKVRFFLVACWFRNDRMLKMNGLESQEASKNVIFILM